LVYVMVLLPYALLKQSPLSTVHEVPERKADP
jgi:hypothetical protein